MLHPVAGVTVHREAELLTVQNVNHIYNHDKGHFESFVAGLAIGGPTDTRCDCAGIFKEFLFCENWLLQFDKGLSTFNFTIFLLAMKCMRLFNESFTARTSTDIIAVRRSVHI